MTRRWPCTSRPSCAGSHMSVMVPGDEARGTTGSHVPLARRLRRGAHGRRHPVAVRLPRRGGHGVGRDHVDRAGTAHVDHDPRVDPARGGRRSHRAAGHGRLVGARRVPRRRRDRVDARQRPCAGDVRGSPSPPRALRAARPSATDGHAIRGRRAGRPSDRGRAAGGPALREDRRGRPGRRRADDARGLRRIGAHRRIPSVGAAGRGPDPVGRGQRGVRHRAQSRGDGRREHVRGHRSPGGGGREAEGAVRARGRPVRRHLHPGDAGDRRRRVALLGGSGARVVGPGGRHAVPADPGRSHRGGGGHLACRATRDHREGRRSAGDARPREGVAVRQDRHAHGGDPAGRRRRGVRGHLGRSAAPPGRIARPGVAARAGDVDRPGGARSRARPRRSRPTWWSGTARASRARWTAAASRSARRRSSRRGRPCLGAPARSADGRRSTVHRACSSRWTEPWPARW